MRPSRVSFAAVLAALLACAVPASALECTTGNKVIQKGDYTLRMTVVSRISFLSACELRATGIIVEYPSQCQQFTVEQIATPGPQLHFLRCTLIGASVKSDSLLLSGTESGIAYTIVNAAPNNSVLFQPRPPASAARAAGDSPEDCGVLEELTAEQADLTRYLAARGWTATDAEVAQFLALDAPERARVLRTDGAIAPAAR